MFDSLQSVKRQCDQAAFQKASVVHARSRPLAHGTNTTLPGGPGYISESQGAIAVAGQRERTIAVSTYSLILRSLIR